MTREEAKQLLPIIKAFSEGKKIQVRIKLGGDMEEDDWGDSINPTFDLDSYDYRIKPSPTYRPFANAEECWQEMLKHQPFGVVKDKDSLTFRTFTFLDGSGCNFTGYEEEAFNEAFDDIEFADGQPFGVKVEEE